LGKLSEKDLKATLKWLTTIKLLNFISSSITVPIVSALLAQAAVVFTQ
jgi:hypothetical protein